jgi:hypothetical protein
VVSDEKGTRVWFVRAGSQTVAVNAGSVAVQAIIVGMGLLEHCIEVFSL